MRHAKLRHKLGVKSQHRLALLANLAVALITHERIETTLAKAKALRPFVEKLITLAKKAAQAENPADKLHFRRLAIARMRDKKAVAKLFDELSEKFLKREGGYTRIYKLMPRRGDAAPMALIEILEADDEGYTKRKSNTKRARAKASVPAPAATEEEVPTQEAPSAQQPDQEN